MFKYDDPPITRSRQTIRWCRRNFSPRQRVVVLLAEGTRTPEPRWAISNNIAGRMVGHGCNYAVGDLLQPSMMTTPPARGKPADLVKLSDFATTGLWSPAHGVDRLARRCAAFVWPKNNTDGMGALANALHTCRRRWSGLDFLFNSFSCPTDGRLFPELFLAVAAAI